MSMPFASLQFLIGSAPVMAAFLFLPSMAAGRPCLPVRAVPAFVSRLAADPASRLTLGSLGTRVSHHAVSYPVPLLPRERECTLLRVPAATRAAGKTSFFVCTALSPRAP
jgi:hypothetical protein